ncbi:putative mitochondrial 37s ribosomal protein nam9 [Phaeomoniella chlamydospora]|uniref:Small ribosomal subunit protein uS4m n=1 Tax=Phaeomoniella chlamydospora TaxID=158046 RepID=A0A0G2EY86_PHACM|nr:putative mitochondrial 37s ribosomal protein nam9 [Phaeomoniella chlamydospora]
MDPKYLATNDGSVESAGRGSGIKVLGERSDIYKDRAQSIPYMAMTFAPLERRLDTAIFRALFASSTRQARQFVVHGAVKVNGKKMIYPGYLLNPGDLFQVDPDRVMYATGKPKLSDSAKESEDAEAADATEAGAKPAAEAEADESEPEGASEEELDPKETLKVLLKQAKELISDAPERVAGKRKQDIRAFQKAIKRTLSKSSTSTILTDSLEAQFLELKNLLKIPSVPSDIPQSDFPKPESSAENQVTEVNENATAAADKSSPTASNTSESTSFDLSSLTDSDIRALHRAMELLRDNPVDPSKPYATPWSPRDYMSAFAFIPRYLEVNQNICAAVYLRHPVARPGLAEVPSPYAGSTQSEAFAWYLRRR